MKNEEIIDMDNPNGEVNTTPESKLINEAEWVFQFDDDEPQVFSVTPEDKTGEPLSITVSVSNDSDSNVVFSNGDKKFSIYSREITEVGREFRKTQQLGNRDETQK
jgi:hypothetical protein